MNDLLGKDISPLAKKMLYLFDMDGTVYLDENLFDGVADMLTAITQKGGEYVFITNNASKGVKDYVAKMHRLGLSFVTEKHFYTSAQCAVALMQKNHFDDLIYLHGTRSFVQSFEGTGLKYTTSYDEKAKAVLIAYDPEITAEKLWTTCKMLTQNDVAYYATNPDWVCPVDYGYFPDCGWMSEGIRLATGKTPQFIGKPQPTMIETVMNKLGYKKEQTVVIGDRLYTDIASGNNAGVDTVCVLSGEATKADVLAASGNNVPTYLLASVTDLPM